MIIMPQQTDNVETAFKRLELLLTEVEQFADTLFTESDSRIKIIDTMLIKVLGWQKGDIFTGEPAGKGYLDYKLEIDGLAKAIVEAKRDTKTFDLTNRDCHTYTETSLSSRPRFSS